MPQPRWPIITSSISGISDTVWVEFQKRADDLRITYRDALEEAVRDLDAAVTRGDSVVWSAVKVGRSRAIRMHAKILEIIRNIGAEHDYRQNVVVLTAM